VLFGEHRIAGLENPLAQDIGHVTAIVRDIVDKVRFASQHGEILIAVNRMDRLHVNTLENK
jgi:hypothetical protein